jgi:aspartyl-tRNA(Asn)/glutamyl-tRNA(Gln) amidotransferase subunit A
MTRTVGDAALMMSVIAGPDARDWFSLPSEGRDYRLGLDDGVRGLRIAFSPALGYAPVDPEVAALVAAAVEVFAELGAKVEQVDPGFDNPAPIFRFHWYAGAANLLRGFTAGQKALMDRGLVEVASEGAAFTLLDYLGAVNARGALGVHMRQFHERYDLLLTPTLPLPAFKAGAELVPGAQQSRWVDWTPFSYPFNLTQQPAASAPCGFTKAGLPVGLHIVGPMFEDGLVLRAARAFESARPFVMPRAPKIVT